MSDSILAGIILHKEMLAFHVASIMLRLDGEFHFLQWEYFSLPLSPPSLEVNKSSRSCHPSKCVPLSSVCACVFIWLCVRETAVSRVPGVALFFLFLPEWGPGGIEWVNEAASASVKPTPGRRQGFLYSIFPSLGINRQLPIPFSYAMAVRWT